MSKIRLGVLRGGVSSEYDVSLRSGANILNHIDHDKYIPRDILLTKNMEWIMDGLLVDLLTIANSVDLVWVMLHGEFGEDGKVQRLLEQFGIPYTGSGVLPSAVAMNKQLAKDRFRDLGILTPSGVVIHSGDDVEESVFAIFKSFAMPVVIKPLFGGSSVGVTLAKNYEQLFEGVERAIEYGDVLVEECIKGREATCAVVEGEDDKLFALHPIEIIPDPGHELFDYEAKYGGKSQEICPGNFSHEVSEELMRTAAEIHRGLGLRHYSRSDFIISPRGIYALEVNTIPGMTEQSLVPKALSVSGVTVSDLIDHIVSITL